MSFVRKSLDELLEKYAERGAAQFVMPDVVKVLPVSEHRQIIKRFGGAANEVQTLNIA